MVPMPSGPRKTKSMFGNMKPSDIKALGIGLELTMVIGGLAYGGHWLDQKWDTGPWLLLTGVIIGTLGGSWHAMKMANGGKVPDLGLAPKKKEPAAKPDSTASTTDEKPTP